MQMICGRATIALLLLALTCGSTSAANATSEILPQRYGAAQKNNANEAIRGATDPVLKLDSPPDVPLIKLDDSKQQQHSNASPSTTFHNGTAADNHTPRTRRPPLPSGMGGADEWIESGAIWRAFYVLLGATLILVVYIAIRMYRLRTGSSKPSILVRKYGVLANRSDVEMLPLPLDEEDEDDTVFEVNRTGS